MVCCHLLLKVLKTYYLRTLELSSMREIVKQMFETLVALFKDGIAEVRGDLLVKDFLADFCCCSGLVFKGKKKEVGQRLAYSLIPFS